MLNIAIFLRFIERKERKVRLDRPVSCIFAGKKILALQATRGRAEHWRWRVTRWQQKQ